ncbi:MAG: hypothetical protein H7039_18270 [Bryobacteraceae bacterium]|nr:hypothetical protein [Bryobacteraceae bacterium]
MKTILTFIAGAVLASGLVYLMMSRNTAPQVAETAVVQTPAADLTPAPVSTPEATEVGPDSITPAAEQPKSAPPVRPSATPRTEKARNSVKNTSAGAVPVRKPSDTASGTSTDPAANEQIASGPAPVNPNGGPMLPSDPYKSPLPPPPPDKPKRVPQTVTIPVGTTLSIRLDQNINSSRSKTGETFGATLDQILEVDGAVIAERGSRVEGRIVEADPGGRVNGLAQLQLELVRLNTSDGQRVKLSTESFTKQATRETGKDVAKVGAAAGIGAAIGAIAGGGKGAGLGAIIGGAAGTGGVLGTRGAAAQLPAETRLSFRLREAITITERLD